MRSHPEKFRNPLPLHERMQLRAEEAGYKNVTEYLLGLVRYDFLTRKPHYATARLNGLTRAEQDRMDDEIARMFDSGETLNGSWLMHQIEKATADVAAGVDLSQDRIVNALLERIKGK